MEKTAIEPAPLAGTSVKLIIGGFFVLLGVMLTLDNLGVIDGERYLAWWPMTLVAIGAIKLFAGGRVVGTILIVAGAWLTADNLGMIRFTLFDLWPLLLIVAGLALVARAVGFVPERSAPQPSSTTWGVLGIRKIAETSRDFGGRRYVGFLGGCEIDLTGAEISKSPAVIETYAVWAAIEITVPDRWEIVGEVVPIMGGFEAKVHSADAPEKQLIVRGAAVMGAVEIKSAPGRSS
ncbi:MAG TPA: DUF5668 domain-containing protein [Thermoanaerobaculia bacterium]|nr:DUF5668 domain-containing protein [Thermoanaerobaculia bacterium]